MKVNAYCDICQGSRVFIGSVMNGIFECEECHINKRMAIGRAMVGE